MLLCVQVSPPLFVNTNHIESITYGYTLKPTDPPTPGVITNPQTGYRLRTTSGDTFGITEAAGAILLELLESQDHLTVKALEFVSNAPQPNPLTSQIAQLLRDTLHALTTNSLYKIFAQRNPKLSLAEFELALSTLERERVIYRLDFEDGDGRWYHASNARVQTHLREQQSKTGHEQVTAKQDHDIKELRYSFDTGGYVCVSCEQPVEPNPDATGNYLHRKTI